MTRSWPLVLFVLVAALIFARTPAMAAGETISGTVTAESTGDPISGVCVAAHDPADEANVTNFAGTDAFGNYTLTVPAEVSYVVSFRTGFAPCGTNATPVVTEYWDNETAFATADPILVTTGVPVTADAALAFPAPATTGTIVGVVTTTQGTGLEGVCVAALDSATDALVSAGTSNATGNYTIPNLPPADYKVIFTTDTTLGCPAGPSNVVTEYFDDELDPAAADPVTVTAGFESTADAGLDSKPVAENDSATVTEDSGTTNIEVLGNDTDLDDPEVIEIEQVSAPAHGSTAIVQGTPDKVGYTPDANYCGADSFTYTVNGDDTATVSVTVTCVDDPTTAVNDTHTVNEDAPATSIDVRLNDTDVDAKATILSVTQGSQGTVTIGDGHANVRYAPMLDECNSHTPATPDTFTYTLNGGSTATVQVTIICVDDPSVALDDDADDVPAIVEDSGATTIDVRANDTDNDSTKDLIDAKTNGSKGTVAINGAKTAVTYTPNANFCGEDSFTYTLAGPARSTAQAAVEVNVTCVDDPTTAVADSLTVPEDSPGAILMVRDNDTDVDTKAPIASKTDPAHGTLTITGAGAHVTYAPAANYCGADSFTYTLTGGSSATVALTVSCVDDPPTAVDHSFRVDENSGETVLDVTSNATDIDGGDRRPSSASDPEHGTVRLAESPALLTYKPDPDYCGTDSFTYTLSPGDSRATVTITVTCAEDPVILDALPIAVDDRTVVAENSSPNTIYVMENDSDPDDDPFRIVAVTQGAHGKVVLSEGGTDLTYQPARDYCGPDSFKYALNGGAVATVTITVACVDLDRPDTRIRKGPKKKFKTKKKKVKVTFVFRSEPNVDFQCRIDKKPWKLCTSPVSYRLKPGKHTFQVFATDGAGNSDVTPATKKFTIVKQKKKKKRRK